MKKLILLLFLTVVIVVAKVKNWVYEPGRLEKPVQTVVSKGATVAGIALQLKEAGVIEKPWLFRLAARWYRLDTSIKAGEYEFTPHISMFDAIEKMARGEVLYRKITVPEGLTTRQILDIIEADDNLCGEITLRPDEGGLLPETYSFVYGDTKDSIIRQAQEAMKKAVAEAWERRAEGLPVKNSAELLVLASIVEKETGIAEERGLVASVFVNRLRKGMRLQTDPTVIYALTSGRADLERALTRKDLEVDSPYNTYKYYGLPPKPICNPGLASLLAAANPEMSDYLYFVASGDGGHNFAASLNDHNKNVSLWKKKRKP
ncbi:MAG: endolytic transglycosylase MltG [Alphaproteobacteria bacterium]|nr:endolytic transglycosylase MltG [Alphaproteobacteria bacterium]